MKTVLINCSPKKRFCASAYFLGLQRLFIGGTKVAEKLRTPADHDRILEQLDNADAVVFCLPLYVDGIPSHVLRFKRGWRPTAGKTICTPACTASPTTASSKDARTSL